MSGISYRYLPRIASLNQVGVEGGQHGFRHAHNEYNNHHTDGGYNNMNCEAGCDNPRPRLCNKKPHSLRCAATVDDTTPRERVVDQIQGLS